MESQCKYSLNCESFYPSVRVRGLDKLPLRGVRFCPPAESKIPWRKMANTVAG